MILPEQQWKFITPKTKNAGKPLFFVLVDGLINTYSQTVNPPGCFTVRIKCFSIRKIVEQGNKPLGHFIRVFGLEVLVFVPPFRILFYKESFPHSKCFGNENRMKFLILINCKQIIPLIYNTFQTMSTVQISTPFNIALDFDIAPFHKRLLAYILDLTIQLLYLYFMKQLVYSISGLSASETLYKNSIAFDILLICVPLLLYHLICEITLYGQSLGKKALNIRVMSLDGGDPTLSQYLIRWILRFWEWPLFFGILALDIVLFAKIFYFIFGGIVVVIIIAVTQKNQRLGDLAANTTVVNTKINSSIHDTVFMEITQKDYAVKFSQVLKLSDRDINTIKTVLNQSYKSGKYETAHRIADRIKQVLAIETDMDVDLFLEQLIADYNFLATRE
jgi:uncharacterized RDD family membrane protein YckC